MIGVFLQNESPGRIQGTQALATWGPHTETISARKWEKRAGKDRSSHYVYPFNLLSLKKKKKKAGISKGKIRKSSTSNNIKNCAPKMTPAFRITLQRRTPKPGESLDQAEAASGRAEP